MGSGRHRRARAAAAPTREGWAGGGWVGSGLISKGWDALSTAGHARSCHRQLDRDCAGHRPVYAGTTLPVVDGVIDVDAGGYVTGLISFVNTGLSTWTPATTTLAPLLRDVSHPLATDVWQAGSRVSRVLSGTAPGETGVFPNRVSAPESAGESLSLSLVEEGVTWFSDMPSGGRSC